MLPLNRFSWTGLLNKYSHSQVFALDLAWTCCRLLEATKFSRNPSQFLWVTRETRYHVSIGKLTMRILKRQVAELVQRPKILMKILYFSWEHQFSKYRWWWSLNIAGIEDFSIYWMRRHILFHLLDRERNFGKSIDQGSQWETSHGGNWTGCMQQILYEMSTDSLQCWVVYIRSNVYTISKKKSI